MADPNTLLTTTQLLNLLKDPANQGVWAVLDRRYRPIIFSVAMKTGLGAEDAADIAQESLSDVVTGYRDGRFDRSRGRLRTWIMTIARRRVTDALRVRYRKADQRGDRRGDSAFSDVPADDSLDAAWNEEEQKELVREATELLLDDESTAPTSRRVFELVCIKGVPADAAAELCGVEVDQVYVIKHRMVSRLREKVVELQEAREISEEG